MYILVAEAEAYKKDLEAKFPGVSIHAVTTHEDIRDHVHTMGHEECDHHPSCRRVEQHL